jgi:hypothetical protein
MRIIILLLVSTSLVFSEDDSKNSSKAVNDPAKKVEAKSVPKEASSKPEPPKKELPPIQKDGGYLVLNGLKWQAENIQKKSYILAKEECEKNNMRLPEREELVDAYFSKHPEFRTPGGYYVSGTRVVSNRSMIWYVNFDNGHHNHGTLTREYNVRCVLKEVKTTNDAKESKEAKNSKDSKDSKTTK